MLNKTSKGADVLRTRSINLPPKQRTLLLLANGARSTSDLLKQTAGIGASQSDLDALISAELLVETAPVFPDSMPMQGVPSQIRESQPASELSDLRSSAFQVRDKLANQPSANPSVPMSNFRDSMPLSSLPMSIPEGTAAQPVTEAERFEAAYRAATKLSAELGLRGFRLQLSIERASTVEDLRDLRPKLLEALSKESGEAEGLKRIRPLDRLLR